MPTPLTKEEKIADEIYTYVYNACGDAGASQGVGYDAAMADDWFNDPGVMEDMIGDQLCEHVKHEDKEKRGKVIDVLQKRLNHLPEKMWKSLRRN